MKKCGEKELAKKLLSAAKRGEVELPLEEQYLISDSKLKKKNAQLVDGKLASQGLSLIEQVRSKKPVDLIKRNLKYIKYTDSRPIDTKKANTMMTYHMNQLSNKEIVRKCRAQVTGLREPKKKIQKRKGVFGAKDFKNISTSKIKKSQDSDGRFI